MEVLEFWSQQEANLRNLQAQLDSAAVKRVLGVLEAGHSSYLPAFSRPVPCPPGRAHESPCHIMTFSCTSMHNVLLSTALRVHAQAHGSSYL